MKSTVQQASKPIAEFDLPQGTVVWNRFPKLEYNPRMIQKNRIKIIPDERNGNYLLLFTRITIENGIEKEDEIDRIVFKDKADFLEFKEVAIAALNNVQ